MHPIVFTEFHQSKRAVFWQLLLFLGASAVMQYFFGPLAVLLILSPAAAVGIGVGTLSEEYSKGTLRFFYSMPIAPAGIWRVKVLSGIMGASLVVAVVCLPALFMDRPYFELPGSDRLMTASLLPLLAGQAILAYAAGLFAIGFCQVPATANLLGMLISTIPPLIYVFYAVTSELNAPGVISLGLGLAAMSLPLWIGAYVLFRCRNPFVDQPWRWRGVAALFGGCYVLVTIGVGYAMHLHPAELTDPYGDGVYHFTVLADDSGLLALGRRGLWDVEAYVLDREGRLDRHLFHADRALYLMPDSTLKTPDSSMILCRQHNGPPRGNGGSYTMFLLNLHTGAQTAVSQPEKSDPHTYHINQLLSRDGRSIIGFKVVHQGDRTSYSAFRQDLITSDVREVPVFEGEGHTSCFYLDETRVLVDESASDKPEERKLTIIDLQSGARTLRQLPADVRQTFLAPDGRTCAALRWTFQGDTIRQELAVMDVSTGSWKTLFSPEELPSFTVRDAAANRQPQASVSYLDRQGTDWIVCTVERRGAAAVRWLINTRTDARFQLPEKGEVLAGKFSKDGSRFFTDSWLNEEESERNSSNRLVSIYQIKDSGIELVNSFRDDEHRHNLEWLGNDKLLYLKLGNQSNDRLGRVLLADRGELWIVDVATGQRHPFFAVGPAQPAHGTP
jgi:hypothetical protein